MVLLNEFIISAHGISSAQSSAAQGRSMATSLVTFGLICNTLLLIIRPQKRDKEAKQMIASIAKNKVVTIGSIHGTVVAVRETTVVIEVDDNSRLSFLNQLLAALLKERASKASAKNKQKLNEPKLNLKLKASR